MPIKKFKNLLDDVFEAEDSLSPEEDFASSLSQLPSNLRSFFSAHTTDPSRPLLSDSLVTKIAQTVAQVAYPSTRTRRQAMSTPMKRRNASQSTDAGVTDFEDAASLAEMDQSLLGRLLRMLERNVALSEDLNPFAGEPAPVRSTDGDRSSPSKKTKPQKSKSKKASKLTAAEGTRRSSSRDRSDSAPAGDASDGAESNFGESQDITEDRLFKLSEDLEKAKASVASAGCCIALLAADALSKQVSLFPRNLSMMTLFLQSKTAVVLRRTHNVVCVNHQESTRKDSVSFY